MTIDTIHQTQEAVKVLWVYLHYSRHAAWPTVILRFMKARWKTLALSTQNLIKWMKTKNKNCWQMYIYRTDHIQ